MHERNEGCWRMAFCEQHHSGRAAQFPTEGLRGNYWPISAAVGRTLRIAAVWTTARDVRFELTRAVSEGCDHCSHDCHDSSDPTCEDSMKKSGVSAELQR